MRRLSFYTKIHYAASAPSGNMIFLSLFPDSRSLAAAAAADLFLLQNSKKKGGHEPVFMHIIAQQEQGCIHEFDKKNKGDLEAIIIH
jgi:hypothetical protein